MSEINSSVLTKAYADIKEGDRLVHRVDGTTIEVLGVRPSGEIFLSLPKWCKPYRVHPGQYCSLSNGRTLQNFGKRAHGGRAHVGIYSTNPEDLFYDIQRGMNWNGNGNEQANHQAPPERKFSDWRRSVKRHRF